MNKNDVLAEFQERADLTVKFAEKYADDVLMVGQKCVDSLKNKGKIIFCGNGGSAADAQHLAAELVGKYKKDRRPLKGLSLTTNTSNLTAIANDYGAEFIFKRQVEAWGEKGDVLFAISTSGNSVNVIEAVNAAKKLGVYTVGLLGKDGGKMKDIVDFAFVVPSSDTPRIQEVHITLGQILCNYIESTIFD